jgi:hypothetical protein
LTDTERGFKLRVDLVDEPVDRERRTEGVAAVVGVGELDGKLTGRRIDAALVLAAEGKPNDAGPVNTGLSGGRYPPPRPVHAVRTTARMPATASSKIDRRKNPGAPVFIGVLSGLGRPSSRGPGSSL